MAKQYSKKVCDLVEDARKRANQLRAEGWTKEDCGNALKDILEGRPEKTLEEYKQLRKAKKV